MRLTDLNPHWFEFKGKRAGFTFLCPHCQQIRLACTLQNITHDEHMQIFGDDNEHHGHEVVPGGYAWAMLSAPDFNVMTVTPSINAEASGHWHGFITNGEIV